MGRRQVKQPFDGAYACDELAGDLFFCKYRNALELALVPLEWAFAACVWLASYSIQQHSHSSHSSSLWECLESNL